MQKISPELDAKLNKQIETQFMRFYQTGNWGKEHEKHDLYIDSYIVSIVWRRT